MPELFLFFLTHSKNKKPQGGQEATDQDFGNASQY